MLGLFTRASGPTQIRHAVGKRLSLPSAAQGTRWAGTGDVATSGCLEHRLVANGMASSSQRRSYVPAGTIDYLNPAHFLALLKSHDTTFFTGVPDSFLKNFSAYITDTVDKKDHVIAANEGAAISLAAGHHLATGKIPCVYLQNFTSSEGMRLLSPNAESTPTLMLIGWGGEAGEKDELVREMDIPFDVLPDYAEGAFKVLDKAYKYMETEKGPYAMLVRRETFGKN